MTDESVFAAALAIPSPADRAAYLARACADKPALRAEVDALLAAHAASNPLDRPPADLGATGGYEPADGPPAAAVGDRVGPYRLMEQIGEGGMGLVFVAEQTEPVRRKVALKVIKPGMDTRQVVARFEAERQALALMDHPHIARVLDAGATPEGRPYFVMELVRGLPITDYCDQQKLPPRERLALFVQVCQAVQHAHQKGVIHRDIKPSNVLVAPHDGVPVVKVIDFGVAKAVGQSLTDKTIYTRFAQMIGTPLYMSPEQAEVNQLDVDTRADVYALGVLLYELLTGTTPFDGDRFRKAAFDEIRRILREEDPPRPSTRLTSLGETLTGVSARRGTDPARLAGLIRGELDWIVMKCLEKDRNRRYDTAAGLAKDVQRHLAGELVEARPPTLGYRVRKFLHRNRTAITVGLLFAVTLKATTMISIWQASRAFLAEAFAERQRDEAVAARYAEAERRAEAEAARRVAELSAAGLQIDIDLAEVRTNDASGMLRLARTLNRIPADGRSLREFTAIALLAAGQRRAPLLPPIAHDGHVVSQLQLGPDGETLLALGADQTARLWDLRTARQVAVLRRDDERVVICDFSSDGRTVVTRDVAGCTRVWSFPGGHFRAEIGHHAPLDSFVPNSGLGDRRLLTPQRRVESWRSETMPEILTPHGSVKLWDTDTGRLVARLDAPGRDGSRFHFLNAGRWVTTVEGPSVALIFAADDGRVTARLTHPVGEDVIGVAASPSGRRAATLTRDRTAALRVRVWDADPWRTESPAAQLVGRMPTAGFQVTWTTGFTFWTEDTVAVPIYDSIGDSMTGWELFRIGRSEPIGVVTVTAGEDGPAAPVGDLVHHGNGRVSDIRAAQPLRPPAGRKYHPELARFAPDGRIVPAGRSGALIDAQTEKEIPGDDWPSWRYIPPRDGRPGYWVAETVGSEPRVKLVSADRLNLPPEVLELWAQVVVRGELGPEGEFVPWDEEVWQRKRRQLAATPPPYPDFPFPGHVAADGLYWLRTEFGEAKSNADRLRLARALLLRASAAGDHFEAVRWRDELGKLEPAVAPPPRLVRP